MVDYRRQVVDGLDDHVFPSSSFLEEDRGFAIYLSKLRASCIKSDEECYLSALTLRAWLAYDLERQAILHGRTSLLHIMLRESVPLP